MQNWLAVFVLGLLGSGCASDLARASSPATGCAPDEIEVSDISVGWAETSWSAKCRGMQFYCAGETAAACSPDLASASTSLAE